MNVRPWIKDLCPGAFLQSREQSSDHHHVRPGGNRLGQVAGVADSAVGDDRNPALLGHLGGLVNRGNLRNADAGNHPRGADRARPDADLHGVGPGGDQVLAPFGRGHVAGHDVDVPLLLDAPDGFDDVGRMAVGTVDHQHIDAFADQGLDPLVIVNADGGTRSQPALPIFAGLRKPPHHINVFDGNQSGQPKIFVNQQKLLHLFCH